MVAGGAAGTVVIQNGFKPIYGFEWTPRRRGGGRGGEGEGEAAIGIYCLPSNSQILSQAALILHEEDDGRNGATSAEECYSRQIAPRPPRVAVFNEQTSLRVFKFFPPGHLFLKPGVCARERGNGSLSLSLSLATASWNVLVFLTLASAHPLQLNVV